MMLWTPASRQTPSTYPSIFRWKLGHRQVTSMPERILSMLPSSPCRKDTWRMEVSTLRWNHTERSMDVAFLPIRTGNGFSHGMVSMGLRPGAMSRFRQRRARSQRKTHNRGTCAATTSEARFDSEEIQQNTESSR